MLPAGARLGRGRHSSTNGHTYEPSIRARHPCWAWHDGWLAGTPAEERCDEDTPGGRHARPTFNLSTEAGIAWIYEDYRNAGTRDEIAGRLAYHVDWRPVSALLLFHNFEWLPAFSGPFDDYLINTDAGARVDVIGSFFTEFNGELRRDTTPAPGRKENDWRFLVGVG